MAGSPLVVSLGCYRRSMSKVTAFANVEIVLRVEVGSWGEDCKIDQILKQSREMAEHRIQGIFTRAAELTGKLEAAMFPDVKLSHVGKIEIRLVDKQ